MYDPEIDNWTIKKPIPTKRSDFTVVVYQNKIYVLGGKVSGNMEEFSVGVNEVYDPETDKWETRKPIPTPRAGVFANVVSGRIYVIGGYKCHYTWFQGVTEYSRVNEAYDPVDDTWITKAPIPTFDSKPLVATAVVNNKIYALSYDATYVYDPVRDDWSINPPMPKKPYTPHVVVVDNKIYIFGYGSTQIYDTETNTWSLGEPLPRPNIEAVAVTTGVYAPRKIYAFCYGINYDPHP